MNHYIIVACLHVIHIVAQSNAYLITYLNPFLFPLSSLLLFLQTPIHVDSRQYSASAPTQTNNR